MCSSPISRSPDIEDATRLSESFPRSLRYDLINSFEMDYIFENKPIDRFKNKPTIEIASEKLNSLETKIKNIANCELKKNAKNIVFSDGNSKSPVMIVGEGPGQKEDELGKPFVGDAGLLLNKMLKSINIERQSVYITNVVNYRPPENRKPEPSEISRYTNYLKQHISIIDPKCILKVFSFYRNSQIFLGFHNNLNN